MFERETASIQSSSGKGVDGAHPHQLRELGQTLDVSSTGAARLSTPAANQALGAGAHVTQQRYTSAQRSYRRRAWAGLLDKMSPFCSSLLPMAWVWHAPQR